MKYIKKVFSLKIVIETVDQRELKCAMFFMVIKDKEKRVGSGESAI